MSKPYDKVQMKAFPIKVTELLNAPGFYKGQHILAFEVSERQMHIVQNFCRAHPGELTSVLLSMRPYDTNWSKEAQGFLFMVRDRICGSTGDFSAENKEQIYAAAMIDSGHLTDDGERKSLHDLDKREMWILIETMLRLAVEEGCDVSDLEDLGNEVNKGVGK